VNFLILSLPRSGSAWLANFLTYGPVYCYHEPMAEGSLEQLQPQAPLTGAIDTGAWMWPELIPAGVRLFALAREPRRVSRSLRAVDLPDDPDFAKFRETTSGLVTFDYERLFEVEYLRGVWRAIAGGDATFHGERARRLISFNVQRDLDELVGVAVGTYAGV
jgi:hypothetical protein